MLFLRNMRYLLIFLDFFGEDDDFIDAKEFVARKPLYDKIAQQSKQLKNVTNSRYFSSIS